MNDSVQADTLPLPEPRLRRILELRSGFESAWKSGQQPRIEDYLTAVESADQSILLEALLAVERVQRHRLGAESTVEYPVSPAVVEPALKPGLSEIPPGPVHGTPEAEGAASTLTVEPDRKVLPEMLGPRPVCPHCRSPLAPVGAAPANVVCPECGSSFRVEDSCASSTTVEPRALGRFQLLDRVGQGAFGVVWRAFDTQLKRVVALKIPHASLLESADFQTRFWREAQAAAALRHPGIVSVHETITDSALTAIVSEFVDGVTLKDLLEVRKLTFHEAARLIAEAARALHHAHERGLVHRDIKPANIMIESPGSPRGSLASSASPTSLDGPLLGRPLIVDFGLALGGDVEIVLTMEGQIIGTPAYMSPEQAAGKGHEADRRSDVYALGVVLYELLCGELPFRGSRAMVVHQVLHEPPRPPRRLNDKVPRDLETICLKAIAKEPSWRYRTALELAEDLERYLSGRAILARHATKPEQVWRWCRRNPALAVASGVAGATALGFVILLGAFAVHNARSVETLTRLSASLALDHGLSQCEMGEGPTGLLWLARALRLAPKDARDLQRVIRKNLAGWVHESARLKRFAGGDNDVEIVSLDSDGKSLVTVTERGLVRLRDLETDGRVTQMFQSPQPIVAATLACKGSVIVTADADATAQLWDGSTGKPRGPSLHHPDKVVAIALSRDGAMLATAARDHKVRIWRTSDGTPIGAPFIHDKPILALAFSPAGDLLMSGTLDRKVRLWDLASGQVRREIADTSTISAGSFSPDGKRLATAGVGRTARIWDVTTGKPLGPGMVHQEQVRTIAFSPDGSRLVTGSSDKTARLWDSLTAQPIGPGLLHATGVVAAAFHPEGKTFATVGTDGSVRHWEFAGDEGGKRLQHSGDIVCVAISRDGRRVLTASGAAATTIEARIWNAAEGRLAAPPIRLPDSALTCAFDQTDRLGLIATHEGVVLLVDAATGLERHTINEREILTAATFCSSDKYICTGTVRGNIRLRSTETGELGAMALDLGSPITALCASAASESVLVGTDDGRVASWNTSSGAFRQERRHEAPVISVGFGADENTVISASWDHTVCVYDAGAPKERGKRYLKHDDRVTTMAVSPDGKLIMAGCADHMAHFWDVATGQPRGPSVGHHGLVAAAAFAAEGSVIVTGSWDRTARMWDLTTRRPIGPRFEHGGSVQTIAAAPAAPICVSGSFDGTARVWQIPSEVQGDPVRIALWCELITGMTLDANDAVRVLDAPAWNRRLVQLEQLGGPPGP